MKLNTYDLITDYITSNQNKFYQLAFSYVHSKDAAMDVVQNSIMKALENYQSIRKPEFIRTWFYRVLVNESLAFLQKNSKEMPYAPEDMAEGIHWDCEPAERSEVYHDVDSLPSVLKTIIILHYYEDLTLKEISSITETNLNTVKYRLYRALNKIKEMIKEDLR